MHLKTQRNSLEAEYNFLIEENHPKSQDEVAFEKRLESWPLQRD